MQVGQLQIEGHARSAKRQVSDEVTTQQLLQMETPPQVLSALQMYIEGPLPLCILFASPQHHNNISIAYRVDDR